MVNVNLSENQNFKANYTQILRLVKNALEDAKLLDQLVIEERSEGFMVKPKLNNKDEKIRAFESLAGSAVDAGDNIKELINMADRKQDWRSKDVE
ncbi:hypothetical protein PY093_19510 [Cytobacillus sp. S13-E01]|uniref:hypothetical protein n=1 Tax=Cytobacillus sp. S13-E01 TaxID=3031326 RepID=UPI0023D8A2CA|nr:hypothetical protein [Cytobacillus sp. S13-E01]MDF0728805.1 hypothetical protein [Cytobacillus sp. S13-E01]